MLQLAIGLMLGLVAGAYALQGIHLPDVWDILGRTHLWAVALSLALVVATQPVKALRWQLLFGLPNQLPFGQALRGLLIGQAVNLLLPARAGDFARAYLVGRRLPPGSVFTFYTVLVEKVFDVFMLAVCLAALLWWGPWPAWVSRSGLVVSALSVVLVAVGLLGASVSCREWGQGKLRALPSLRWLTGHVLQPASDMAGSLVAAWQDGRLVHIILCSVLVWGLGAATNWAVLASLDLPVHWSAAISILAAVYVGVVVPGPPGRVGVFHYLMLLVLAAYGVTPSQALACGVLLHLVVVVPALLAGSLAAWVMA